jgi:protein-tyrosine phosphatase
VAAAAAAVAVATTVSISTLAQGVGGRRIALEGVANLRDLGGYRTSDGRETQWGQVFRSGQLGSLTMKDYDTIAKLGIVAVCDLRRDDERTAQPTVWKTANSPQILALPAAVSPGDAPRPDPVAAARNGASAQEVSDLMRAGYAIYPTRFAASFRQIIDLILSNSGPILYHCTAGKDRTGVFTAILLSLLDVPRETVYQDYLLSNEFVPTPRAIAAFTASGKTSLAAAAALLSVERSYLDRAFEAIDKEYGSLDGYRRTALKLTDDDLARLKKRLLN